CVSYRFDNNGPVRPPDQSPPPPPAWYPPPPIPQPKGGSARTGPLPLHPMTLGDLLDGAFKLLKANLRTIAIVAGVFIVPGQLLVAFAQRGSGVSDAIRVFTDPTAVQSSSEPDASAVAATLLAFVVLLV